MNLYDLTTAYMRVQELIEQGEDYEGILETIEDELEIKADGYARIIRNMEAEVKALKDEEKRLADKRKQRETAIDHLKQNLFNSMKLTGKTKFKTDLFSFSIQKNGGTLPVIMDVPTERLPDDLVIIEEKPNLKAIAKLLEEGEVPYAHFGERGESLRIK